MNMQLIKAFFAFKKSINACHSRRYSAKLFELRMMRISIHCILFALLSIVLSSLQPAEAYVQSWRVVLGVNQSTASMNVRDSNSDRRFIIRRYTSHPINAGVRLKLLIARKDGTEESVELTSPRDEAFDREFFGTRVHIVVERKSAGAGEVAIGGTITFD